MVTAISDIMLSQLFGRNRPNETFIVQWPMACVQAIILFEDTLGVRLLNDESIRDVHHHESL